MSYETSIIIQARTGSSRLPKKMLMPFNNGNTILEIIVRRLKAKVNLPIIVATTLNAEDDALIKIVGDLKLPYFRGSEDNVLKRFIGAAEKYGVKKIIRICGDNPFLNLEALIELSSYSNQSVADYISFQVNNKPSIKTHFGFWAEYVTLDALKEINLVNTDPFYREHVTNYIYEHSEQFKIEWIKTPECVNNRDDIRLTIDTKCDFDVAGKIFKNISDRIDTLSIENIVRMLDESPDTLTLMKNEIIKNSK